LHTFFSSPTPPTNSTALLCQSRYSLLCSPCSPVLCKPAKIGKGRHHSGRARAGGRNLGDFDDSGGFDDFDDFGRDFRVQAKRGRDGGPKRPKTKKPKRKMGQEHSSIVSDDTPPETLRERSLAAVAEHIKSGKARRIVVMTGAGISTAAGSMSRYRPKSTETR
jgi:hypothetical protein